MKKIIVLLFILFLDCSNDDSATLDLNDFSINLSGIEFTWITVNDETFEMYLETHDANGNEVLLGSNSSMGDGTINNIIPKVKIESVTSLNISGNIELQQ